MDVKTSVGHKNIFYLVRGDVCEFSKGYFGQNDFCRCNFSAAVAPKDYIVDVLQLKTGKNPKRMTHLQR